MLTKWKQKRSAHVREALEAAQGVRDSDRSTSSGAAAIHERVGMVGFEPGTVVAMARDCADCGDPVAIRARVAADRSGEAVAMELVTWAGCGCPSSDVVTELANLAESAGLGVVT